jgi:hypothetical protein
VIPRELEDKVVAFTDAGTWKHSWHWDRDKRIPWRPITLKGAKQMLQDLGCGGSAEDEIAACSERIRQRYAVANELREIIRKAEIAEISDSHDEGCRCEFCRQAGYVKDEVTT